MGQEIIQVDAFTCDRFAGNPAAVCVMEQAADEDWMRQVAAEMNLSETAFLYPTDHGFNLRWFTPTIEVDLCGHATLSAAHVLFETGRCNSKEVISFHTRSGTLSAQKAGNWIELNFPSTPAQAVALPAGLAEALGIEPTFVGMYSTNYLLVVESDKTVRSLQPNFGELHRLDIDAAIVTALDSTGKHDFVSRFFAPGAGIDEDPVTGSTHCTLGPYWAERLGKTELTAFQASARGGELRLKLDSDRVHLFGQAITVMRGELV